jgi:hypothetical protein
MRRLTGVTHCGDLFPVRRRFGSGGNVYARPGHAITHAKSRRARKASTFRALRGDPRGSRLDFDRCRFAPFSQLGSVGNDLSGSVGSHFLLEATVLVISLGARFYGLHFR